MQQVRFGDRTISDNDPCFLTFEAGPTHDGLDSAKGLVDLAAQNGADAVKFQIIDPDRLVADRKQMFSYEVLVDRATGVTETVEEPLYDILCRRALSHDEWRDVKAHADARGLAFFATVGFDDEIELLEGLGCDSIKIASGDVNHFPLLRKVARTGMAVQLDTGNSSLGEIEEAVDVIRAEGNDRIIIHQCPSGYPAHLQSINLRVLTTLKQMFGLPVAFSDHTPGWEIDIAAVALGANLIEKTITYDRTTRSVEHVMSIEPEQMGAFVTSIRDVETALGSPRRVMSAPERVKRDAVRRSIFLARDVRAGQEICTDDLEFRRPGTGLPPGQAENVVGKRASRDLAAGAMLLMGDVRDT